MSKEISTGIDAKITTASKLSTSAVGWASNVISVLQALQSTNVRLDGAAFKDAGDEVGDVPVIQSDGNLLTSLIDTATAGGSGSSGKVPLLNGSGQIPSTMLSSGSGGGPGLKYMWVYHGNTGPGGASGTDSNRQYGFTWRPRDSRQRASDNYVNATRLLVFCTGGGGAGAHGPSAWDHRKGGGGAAGSTVIGYYNNIVEGSVFTVKVGQGGKQWRMGHGVSADRDGTASEFQYSSGGGSGNPIIAGGGGTGTTNGPGGVSKSGTSSGLSIYLRGGDGHDGSSDPFGGGSGGASFWGGGYSGGAGVESNRGGSNIETSAPGAGSGAANGNRVGSNNGSLFTPNANGFSGNTGMVLILGF